MQALPKRVQTALDQANLIEASMLEARTNGPQSVQDIGTLLAVPPDAPPSAPQEPTATAVSAAPAPPAEDFQAKYKTLQGMYSADVTRQKQAQARSDGQIETLSRQVQELSQARQAAPKASEAPDPKDVEAFGADIIEMVRRYVERETAEIKGRLTTLEREVNGVTTKTAQTAEQQFYTLLDSLVPAWREINEDPRWLAWLGEVDSVYQVPRQAALDRAFEMQDARRVANVFVSFIKSLPEVPVAPPAESLANQVAPSGSASVTPTQVAPKPILSSKSINDFFLKVGRGEYAGREQEQAQLEAVIDLAVAEGRVTQ